MEEQKQQEPESINTGGGAYVEGEVDTQGGDFIGRDKIVSGDSVSGDKISIGKLVFNIASANLKPLFFLSSVGLLGIVGILTVLLWPKTIMPEKMSGTFNIAVAAFDQIVDGAYRPSEEGRWIGERLVSELRNEKPSFPPGSQVQIWGPDLIGSLSGSSTEEKAKSAQSVAERVGANVLIFGFHEQADGQSQVTPKFFVNTPGFEEAQEVVGEHSLEFPIPLTEGWFQSPVLKANVNRQLHDRSVALSKFIIGLSYFTLEDYQSAYDAFIEAEAMPGWDDVHGKEIIYLFLGNAALKAKEFETAHRWFDQAIEINPEYGRAYIGKGATYYQQAIKPLVEKNEGNVDLAMLEAAIVEYQAGLDAQIQPAHADVSAKAHFGLGRSYLLNSWQGGDNNWSDAEEELSWVTDAYDAGEVHLQELAAQAFSSLGLLNYIIGDDNKAIVDYERALELEQYAQFKAEYSKQLNKLYSEKGEIASADKYAKLASEYEQDLQSEDLFGSIGR